MSQPRKNRTSTAQGATSFPGFGPKALQFFHNLAANQNREWFQQHQPVYEQEVQRPLSALVVALAHEFVSREVPLTGDPKRSLFRIHRDVRFSHNKSPYKTNAGAILSRDGTRNRQGMLYIHIAPEGSFMASGFYQPAPDQLLSLRKAIAADFETFQTIERSLRKSGLSLSRGDALQRLPRGFEDVPAGPLADTLKLKSFFVQQELSESLLSQPRLVHQIADFAATALPLLTFGWAALDRGQLVEDG